MTYGAPLDEMRFALRRIAGLSEVAALPGYEEATDDLVDAVLEEAGKLAAEVLAPLNAPQAVAVATSPIARPGIWLASRQVGCHRCRNSRCSR